MLLPAGAGSHGVCLPHLQRLKGIVDGHILLQVVGTKHSAWKKYIQRNSHVFDQFSQEEGKWRMRLLRHENYKDGDAKEEKARDEWETHFTNTLVAYLESLPTKTSSLDDFMRAYPSMSQCIYTNEGKPKYALPHRGDLVRFIRRSTKFSYEQSSYIIGFKGEPKEKERAPERAGECCFKEVKEDKKEENPKKEKLDLHQKHFANDTHVPPPHNLFMGLPPNFCNGNDMMDAYGSDTKHPDFFNPFPPQLHHHQPLASHLAPQCTPNTQSPTVSGSSSEGTSPAARALPPGHTPEAEKQVTDIIVGYLHNPNINPFKGSVPVERIQNIFRGRYASLYEQVVGSKHSAWKRYIERNSDVFRFFPIEEGKWRMRLLCHTKWQEGDQQEEAAREALETHFTNTLTAYLELLPEKKSSLDAFMEAYPSMPQNKRTDGTDGATQYPLPHRGDLVRFIRRSTKFSYEQSSYLIGFKDQTDEDDADKNERAEGKEEGEGKEREKDKKEKVDRRDKREEKEKEKNVRDKEEAEKEELRQRGLNPYAPCFRPRSDCKVGA